LDKDKFAMAPKLDSKSVLLESTNI
jgi:hypothetical protein